MAKKRMPSVQPAVYELYVPTGTIPAQGQLSEYIDLSQITSIVNRRFMRQGLNWAVGSFTVLSQPAMQGSIAISKLGTNWQTGGSWEKTMRHWLKQQNEALEDAGAQSVTARFRDYKIHMDDEHVANGFANNLMPFSSIGTFVPGEWEASQIVIPNDGAPGVTNEYVLKMYGASDVTSKGILEGYVLSRSVPQTPDPSTTGSADQSWLSEMINVGDSEDSVLVNAQYNNRNLPYNQNLYPGQAGNGEGPMFHHVSYISGTTVGGTTHIQGGNFPCGLIKLDMQNETDVTQNLVIQINLVPGPHRGYLCEKMEDF